MIGVSAFDLVRTTRARIDEARATVGRLAGERAALALRVAQGDAEAAAESARIRGEIAAATALIEDLTASLGDLDGFARLEQAATDAEAGKERRRRARHIAEAHVRAAEAVDEAVAALAVAMQVADRAAALAHATAAPLLGRATSMQTTRPSEDAVLGQLTILGALGADHLPGVFMGERSYVRPLADAARRHLALVERHVPAEPIETEAAA